MKNRRLKQFGISLTVILSLFASVIAACACSHHSAVAENHAVSCHQMTGEMNDSQQLQSNNAAQIVNVSGNCNCLAKTSQALFVNKFENINIQKILAPQNLTTKAAKSIEIAEIAPAKFHFENHFYNSNYLQRLTPPRAPPVL